MEKWLSRDFHVLVARTVVEAYWWHEVVRKFSIVPEKYLHLVDYDDLKGYYGEIDHYVQNFEYL